MYRKREKGSNAFQRKIENFTKARLRKIEEDPAPDYPAELPDVRRELIIVDHDFQETKHHFILYKSDRVDCYFVEVDGMMIIGRDGKPQKMGWSKILVMARKAFIRVRGMR